MCCQNLFAQHLILHVLETGRHLHTTFHGLPASPRDLQCYEYTHAIAFCRNQKKRPGAESERRAGIGHVALGMARQCYDLQLTQYDEKGWRATFYTTRRHDPPNPTPRDRSPASKGLAKPRRRLGGRPDPACWIHPTSLSHAWPSHRHAAVVGAEEAHEADISPPGLYPAERDMLLRVQECMLSSQLDPLIGLVALAQMLLIIGSRPRR